MSIFVQRPLEDYSGAAFAAFDTDHMGFDLGDARALMWMSQLAYETDAQPTIDAVSRRWAISSIDSKIVRVAFMDTRFIVGKCDDCTIVAFAGTDPALAANLLTDAKVSASGVNTHSGFQAALDSVWPIVRGLIAGSPRPLFFAEHSLGAAIAVLAAFAAHAEGVEAKAVYTFGMPRAGLEPFATSYNAALGDRTFRFVHGGDIVPCIPERLLSIAAGSLIGSPFLHVGRMTQCARNAKFVRGVMPDAVGSNDPRFRDGVRTNMRNQMNAWLGGQIFGPVAPGPLGQAYALLPTAIRDHLPDRYINALSE